MTEEYQKTELVIYNTSNPKLFTVVHPIDGKTLTLEQMEIIMTACKNGPFLAFYNRPDNGEIYRIRGPYHCLGTYYIIDRTGLQINQHPDDHAIHDLKIKIQQIKGDFVGLLKNAEGTKNEQEKDTNFKPKRRKK